jgi:hypothetical protein
MPMCAFKIIICIQIILGNEVVKIANFNCFQKKIIWENFRIVMTQKMEIFVFGVNLKTIDTKMKK